LGHKIVSAIIRKIIGVSLVLTAPLAIAESSLLIANSQTTALVTQKISARMPTGRAAYAAGDMMDGQGTYGPMVFGNSIKQQAHNGIPG
jgi:hypothetical protein